MQSKSVTMKDIAKALNVSTVTVSKALRGHPDISKQTALRVKETAEKLGYTPNYLARSLSSMKTQTIGVVVPKIVHFFFSSVIEGVYDTAFQSGYEIILTISQENTLREKIHIQTLLSMRVEGIIVSITQETKNYEIFHLVKKKGVPLIFIDRHPGLSGFSTICVDDRGGASLAVEQAIKVGYQKIGHIAGYSHINIGKERYQGFVDAMTKHNRPIKPEWIIRGGFGEKDGYTAFMKLYHLGNLPECLFAVTYPVAIGVYRAAKEVGIRIPEDMDIICFGDSDVNQFIDPPLTCVSQPTRELGKIAVEMMMDYLNDPENFKPQHVVLPTELILRKTCNPLYKGSRRTHSIDADLR